MYNDLLKVRNTSRDGTTANVTSFLSSGMTWAGSYQNVCRTLSYGLVQPYNFPRVTRVPCDMGANSRLWKESDLLFSGTILERARSNDSSVIDIVAYDNGIYLKRNYVYKAYTNTTPEAVAAELASEFGIKTGNLAQTGVQITRNFFGTSIYQAIATMYTLAADQTGEKYQIRFVGDVMSVIKKEYNDQTLLLQPGSNLISARYADNASNCRNSVAIYNDALEIEDTVDDKECQDIIGLMQYAIKASAYDDPKATAKQMLEDYGISTTITCECIGNTKLISGNSVVVREPVTGLYGLFWILTDQHTVRRGVYRTKITVSFRNLMDEQQAGSTPTN